MSELRRDPIIGRWVIIASERGGRPSDFKFTAAEPHEDIAKCPFCPGNEASTPPEIMAYHNPGREKNSKDWWLRVIPNKYPALKIESDLDRLGEGMFDRMGGFGAHEVIIENPNHFLHIADMQEKSVEDILWAFRERTCELKKDPRVKYVLIFKNHGKPAGATLSHPHCQLIALPMVPIRVHSEMTGAKKYYDYKERCVFCDMVREEKITGKRVVSENEYHIALEPYASRFPFETWIIPKRHLSNFEDITKDEVAGLAAVVKTTLRKLRNLLNDPPYNLIIHSSPIQEQGTPYYHWHIEIMPKLTQVAGFEWGTGFYINPTPPETAARLLNEVAI